MKSNSLILSVAYKNSVAWAGTWIQTLTWQQHVPVSRSANLLGGLSLKTGSFISQHITLEWLWKDANATFLSSIMKEKLFWHLFSLLWHSTKIQHGTCKGSLDHGDCPSCASSETSAHILEARFVQFVIESELFCPIVSGDIYECVFLCTSFGI